VAEEWRFDFRQRQKIFLFPNESIMALRPTQPPIQWVSGTVSPGISGKGVKLTTHLHLMPKLRMVELHLHYPYVVMM
jgi:hypothetical protein